MRRLIVLLILLTSPAEAGRARWVEVAEDPGARARVVIGDALYSVDAEGTLHATDLDDGDRWTRAGDLGDARMLFGDASHLIALADGGALYDISPTTGAARQIGDRCAWDHTVAGTILAGRLYTIETSGQLYVTDLADGAWREVGEADFPDAASLLHDGTDLYVLDTDGDVQRVDPATGAAETIATDLGSVAALADGRLYTLDAKGTLRATDLARGKVTKRKPRLAGVAAMFTVGDRLIAIDSAGKIRALAL